MSFWKTVDESVRPSVERELKRKGWVLVSGGNHQWTALRSETDMEITTMNPFTLVEKVKAHEKRLRQQRARRIMEEQEASDE